MYMAIKNQGEEPWAIYDSSTDIFSFIIARPCDGSGCDNVSVESMSLAASDDGCYKE